MAKQLRKLETNCQVLRIMISKKGKTNPDGTPVLNPDGTPVVEDLEALDDDMSNMADLINNMGEGLRKDFDNKFLPQ